MLSLRWLLPCKGGGCNTIASWCLTVISSLRNTVINKAENTFPALLTSPRFIKYAKQLLRFDPCLKAIALTSSDEALVTQMTSKGGT